MRRWIGAFLAVVLSCLPIIFLRATGRDLVLDSDTSVLLAAIRQRHAPLSWFAGDWPLNNHFYRPVSTLSFELDNWLYGSNGTGYGLTNALLCIACVLLLFWFLREITDHPVVSACGAALFAFQHVGFERPIANALYYLAVFAGIAGIVRHRIHIKMWLPACLTLLYAIDEVASSNSFGQRTIGWLPGRTATVMTVFALIAMAAYGRYERVGAERLEPDAKPTDPPATRTTRVLGVPAKSNVIWPFVSVCAVALALASYEQAVMLPAVLLAVAVTFRLGRFKVRWGWQAAFWALLLGYLMLRKEVIPAGVSHYQAQQFRSGPGVRLSLLNYAMPFVTGWSGFVGTLEMGFVIFFTWNPYAFLLSACTNLTAFYQLRRRWIWALSGYGMSLLAFLPMAWAKQFGHYHYWPMAIRSLFTVTLIWVGYELTLNACSPRTRQAPPRLDPAPGSLLRP